MAARKKKRVWPLTIFLIKRGLSRADALADRDDLSEVPVRHGTRSIGHLVIKVPNDSNSSWTQLFEGHADLRGLGLRNRSTAAVLFINRGGLLFALTFGYGRHLLEPGSWIENFGLKTTLNMVEPAKIRSIDRKRFDELTTLTREQASKVGSIAQFGLDLEKDVLQALVGTPRDAKLGQSVAGLDALVARVECELKDVPDLLSTYAKQYRKRAYRRNFRDTRGGSSGLRPCARTHLRLDSSLVGQSRDPGLAELGGCRIAPVRVEPTAHHFEYELRRRPALQWLLSQLSLRRRLDASSASRPDTLLSVRVGPSFRS